MTIKENSLLRRGIHSELFLMAYVMPNTGYRISQMLRQTDKRPDTSKTNPALKKLENAGYVVFKNKKYHSNLDRVLKEMKLFLDSKSIFLDEYEMKFLSNLLGENFFSMFVGADAIIRILSQPSKIHHIDALEVICNNVGMMCTFALQTRKKNPENDTTMKKSVSGISKELDGEILLINEKMEKSTKGSKSVKKRKMSAIDSLNSIMKSFILESIILEKTNTSTLEKLEVLWDQRTGYMIGSQSSTLAFDILNAQINNNSI